MYVKELKALFNDIPDDVIVEVDGVELELEDVYFVTSTGAVVEAKENEPTPRCIEKVLFT